jgi:hypothetical protein
MGDIIALAWVAGMGGWVGYHLAERRHRDDLPQWKAALGNVLVRQFAEIRKYEKFAGTSPCCQITVQDDDEAFKLTLERVEVEA